MSGKLKLDKRINTLIRFLSKLKYDRYIVPYKKRLLEFFPEVYTVDLQNQIIYNKPSTPPDSLPGYTQTRSTSFFSALILLFQFSRTAAFLTSLKCDLIEIVTPLCSSNYSSSISNLKTK